MTKELHSIYGRYNNELKPIVAEQETRMSAFEEPLLLNLSMMFDYLSRYHVKHSEMDDSEIEKLLIEVNNILSTCISQSYMYVASSIKDDIRRFERNNNCKIRLKLKEGSFWGNLANLKKEIRAIDKKCKRNPNEYVSNLDNYSDSYYKCLEIEKLIQDVEPEVLLLKSNESWVWTVLGWLLSILISLLVGNYVSKFITEF